jgi:hypothetical protein
MVLWVGTTHDRRGQAGRRGQGAWSLTRDEQRLLWITFAGGLGSIVVGAGVIGGALALTRSIRPQLPEFAILTLVSVVVVTALILRLVRTFRRTMVKPRLWEVRFVRFTPVGLFGVTLCVYALTGIGLAAGVK